MQIEGEVNTPGFYNYNEGLNVKKFIDQAGGLTENANRKDIYIRYPNGESVKYRALFKNPKVMDGSYLFVGRLPEEEPVNKTELLKEVSSIIGDIAQTIILINLAREIKCMT